MVKGTINLYFPLATLGTKLEYRKEPKTGVSFFGSPKALPRFALIIWLVTRDRITTRERMKNWVVD